MSIPLGFGSHQSSSCLPGSGMGITMASLFGIAPDKAFLAANVTTDTGGLLHHHFTLTQHPNEARSHPNCISGLIQVLRGLFLWSWLCIAAASR